MPSDSDESERCSGGGPDPDRPFDDFEPVDMGETDAASDHDRVAVDYEH